MSTMRVIRLGTVALAAVSLGTFAVEAFVPSCEKEIAAAYPPSAKGDLSACAATTDQLERVDAVNIDKFSSRLTGSWELNSRTVYGVTTDFRTGTTDLYFDLGAVPSKGGAMLVDRSEDKSDKRVAFWNVGYAPTPDKLISLSMQSYKRSGLAREIVESKFLEIKNIFVTYTKAENGQAPQTDRIVIMDKSLTRISCGHGVVERFSKVSSDRPRVGGKTLAEAWGEMQGGKQTAKLSGVSGILGGLL